MQSSDGLCFKQVIGFGEPVVWSSTTAMFQIQNWVPVRVASLIFLHKYLLHEILDIKIGSKIIG